MAAFEILFRKYYSYLSNYAFKIVENIDTAEEIIQDLFVGLWEKREELVIETSVKSYLFKSAYNRCLLFLRHKSVTNRYEQYVKAGEELSEPDVSEELNMKELNDIIDRTLDELPETRRTIFRMSRFEGLKYHEIAKKLSLSVKTIESNMGKALKLFRKNIKTYLETT
ncbi:MAG: RNA polymerase sigma-70 factor [Bacteroidales bacterium]|nr:RNA polymerase sigma-70 factor [Bacteroidales bacterium]